MGQAPQCGRHSGALGYGHSYVRQPEIVAMYRFLQLLARYPDGVALVEALSSTCFEQVDLRLEETRILKCGFERGRPMTDEYEREHRKHADKVHQLLQQSRPITLPQLLGLVERAIGLKERYR